MSATMPSTPDERRQAAALLAPWMSRRPSVLRGAKGSEEIYVHQATAIDVIVLLQRQLSESQAEVERMRRLLGIEARSHGEWRTAQRERYAALVQAATIVHDSNGQVGMAALCAALAAIKATL